MSLSHSLNSNNHLTREEEFENSIHTNLSILTYLNHLHHLREVQEVFLVKTTKANKL